MSISLYSVITDLVPYSRAISALYSRLTGA